MGLQAGVWISRAAGLTDHVWTWAEWFNRPPIQAA